MSKKKATAISLPISRTAKIMTSAVGVESVNQDIVATATKATEIFLTDFARKAYQQCDSNVLDYDDITKLVHSDPQYDFLVDTTPKRIKFSEAKKLIQEAERLEAEREAQLKTQSKLSQETKESVQEESYTSTHNNDNPDNNEVPGQIT